MTTEKNYRTRIKFCGITRIEDLQAAVTAGADAIGLVFYERSARYVTPKQAAGLLAALPPFVCSVGLFVNAGPEDVTKALMQAPVSCLQFHGDETPEQCAVLAAAAQRPFLRALRVKPDMTAGDLVKYAADYRSASNLFAGLVLDTWVEGYGGSGTAFDWSVIPEQLAPYILLSGGLTAQNVTEAVRRVRPYAVDVSSGIELDKGIKDAEKMRAFAAAVRQADASDK